MTRIVFVLQWVAVVVLPVWWFYAPGAGNGGWAQVLMLVVAPLVGIVLAVPAIVATVNRNNRRTGTTSAMYAVAAPIMWFLAAVQPTVLSNSDDIRSYPSWMEVWGIPSGVAGLVGVVTFLLFLVVWVLAIVAATQSAERPWRPGAEAGGA